MITLKSRAEVTKIRNACRIVSQTLDLMERELRAGISTKELDGLAVEFIKKQGGRPAFFNYRGYPGNICVSINEEVVHGIPGGRLLLTGDIVGVDVGVELEGYYGDAARTFSVGKAGAEAQKLMDVTREALYCGIGAARKGNRLSDISHSIQAHVEAAGFSVVRELVGHGIGTSLHEEPQVPNYGKPGNGPRLEPGMVLCLEPMVNSGTYNVETLPDQWTIVTQDRRLSAHFEHAIAVTDGDAEILSVSE